ncbi:LacI family DNA-binding transcriptional regulator [Brevibacillus centrosporus]|uniref:Transcriptional regulator, LacI family n=1 Tax=Brevibacillus centrosporus TaxID=54910 RepID=A0A1I3R4A5_9BACL|nr:LacI family DNA-binding transcriptional regulator [Brevibacillus centrosporus]SFJ40860.1 transcriptional regulator, LacI family [Brevibacillus centrosporus]
MKPTIYDVAREAQVSIATVSKVINDSGRISDKTKQRVIAIMEKMKYQPSVVASALTGKQTFTIGLFIPDLANPFFAEIARYVEDRAQENGFSVVMCSTDHNIEKESKYIELLRQKRVDGFILASGFINDEILKELIEEKFPVVMVAQDFPTRTMDSVSTDDFFGGYVVGKHLLELGHKSIGVLAENWKAGTLELRWSSIERLRGIRQAMAEAQVPFHEEHLVICDSSVESGRASSAKFFEGKSGPTAIFATNDVLAIGVVQAAREHKKKLPDDVSIVGFDNTLLSTIVEPRLTTVAHPMAEMARKAMELLLNRMQDKDRMSSRIILPPELIKRDSTRPL